MAGPLLQFSSRRLGRAFETGRIVPFLVTMVGATAVVSALVMRVADSREFPSFGRALWWSVQTVTTVGYGDVTPAEPWGRAVATVLMILGFAFLSILTGTIASLLVSQQRAKSDGIEARLAEIERLLRERQG